MLHFDASTSLPELLSFRNASGILFAIALLASAHSSTVTGTYAGQFVMEGFLNLNIDAWKRNMITRSVAILPSLVVTIATGSSGSTALIMVTSMIMSIQLPFALIPLLKLTASYRVMGEFKISLWLLILCSVVATGIIGANIFGVFNAIFHETSLHGAGLILAAIAAALVGLCYVALLLYLVWRPIGFRHRGDQLVTVQPASAGYVSCHSSGSASSDEKPLSIELLEHQPLSIKSESP